MPDPVAAIEGQIQAHEAAHAADLARLRTLTMQERGQLIEAACEAAMVVYRSRLAMGLPPAERDPWPASTWEFLKRHAARARGES
jgi:hypothetical protein